MTEEQIADLKKSIDHTLKQGIETHVNGKIRVLSEKVDNYIEHDMEWKKLKEEKDDAWKERAEPVILMGQNLSGFGKVSLYVVGFVSAVGGAVILILKLFTKE